MPIIDPITSELLLHKARVRRASGFLLTAFSNARPQSSVLLRSLTKGAPPKKH
jgi:hypothetical protein